MDIAYKRILLKLSGEALAGEKKTGVDGKTVAKSVFDPLKDVSKQRGVSLG